MTSIQNSVIGYEHFLTSVLGKEVVTRDLEVKHRKMRKSAFLFYRATCWRWAELASELCPELASAPSVLAVGDPHIENFGIWHDAESRLVWGVNDFDDAAEIPYAFDIVRLATSALLAETRDRVDVGSIAKAVLTGYSQGLRQPSPFVLEGRYTWLRDLFHASDAIRKNFWADLLALRAKKPPVRYRTALRAALPGGKAGAHFAARRVGAGSLGRPRFVAVTNFRGGPVARECKALVPSCWTIDQFGRKPAAGNLLRAANGAYRSPDPFLAVENDVVIRRLSPDSRKLEIEDIGRLRRPLLEAMGSELANIHAADRRATRIKSDLLKRDPRWLREAIVKVADATIRDWKSFKTGR